MKKKLFSIQKESRICKILVFAVVMLINVISFTGCTTNGLIEKKGYIESETASYAVNENNEKIANTDMNESAIECEKPELASFGVAGTETNIREEVITINTDISDSTTAFEKSENIDNSILKQFNLSDPKIYWDGRVDLDFRDDIVELIMRKTVTYPELQPNDFGLDNIESVEYISIKPGLNTIKEEFRQMLRIKLKDPGRENVIEAIKHFEKLEIIRYAGPLYKCIAVDY